MENTVIRERLTKLRQAMRRHKIDFYLIPTADFHNSEYVNDYFKVREFFSGFTGSNGTLVVSIWEAGLWTDGRYFVQAERELDGTGIKLFRMQEEGVPTVTEYLCEQMEEYYTLGFDGRVVDAALGEKLAEIQNKKKDQDRLRQGSGRGNLDGQTSFSVQQGGDSAAGLLRRERIRENGTCPRKDERRGMRSAFHQ